MSRRRVIIGALAGAALLWLLIPKPPLLDDISFSSAVYDRDGTLLRLTLSDDEKYRLRVSLADLSNQLIDTTLLFEDRYFYFHPGVNPMALFRAAWETYIGGDRRLGASTITMQVARMRFGLNTRTPAGKLTQILRAIQLERHYSKQEILEAYFNLAPYGFNVEGAGAASLVYYDKQARELALAEALTLSVIPQRPAARTPTGAVDADNGELVGARNALFARWVKRHPEDRAQAAALSLPYATGTPAKLPFLAPHLADQVLANQVLADQAASAPAPHAGNPAGAIRTTLDLGLQQLLERRTAAYVARLREQGITNAAALLVDWRDMGVRAEVGSADFFDDAISGQVNGTRARRSPGSTLKPFIYALGMEQGLIHPMTMLKDTPASFGGFNPENFDARFVGPIHATDALIHSRNVPAVYLATRLSSPDLYGFLEEAGIAFPEDRRYYGLALALGGAEISMEELISLYATLAGRGMHRPLRYRLDDPVIPGKRLLSEEAAYLVLDMLAKNPRPNQGYRTGWVQAPLPVYWKTGTSYSYRDAWSVAVFGPYVLAVWVGNFDGRGDPSFVGRKAAAPLLFEMIDGIRSRQGKLPVPLFPGAQKVIYEPVCAVSGRLPNPSCPRTVKTGFIPGKSPIETCRIHRQVTVTADTGLRVCPGMETDTIAAAGADFTPEPTRREVYEFWPTDMLSLFQQAGIPRKVPPAYHPDCLLAQQAEHGVPPQIASPSYGVTYQLRQSRLPAERIPLTAVADADARELFWFVNGAFLGRTPPRDPYFWAPRPGTYTIRVVDDHGRSHAREVAVELVQ